MRSHHVASIDLNSAQWNNGIVNRWSMNQHHFIFRMFLLCHHDACSLTECQHLRGGKSFTSYHKVDFLLSNCFPYEQPVHSRSLGYAQIILILGISFIVIGINSVFISVKNSPLWQIEDIHKSICLRKIVESSNLVHAHHRTSKSLSVQVSYFISLIIKIVNRLVPANDQNDYEQAWIARIGFEP